MTMTVVTTPPQIFFEIVIKEFVDRTLNVVSLYRENQA